MPFTFQNHVLEYYGLSHKDIDFYLFKQFSICGIGNAHDPSQRFPFCLEKPKNFAFSLQKSIFWAKSVKRPLGSKRSNNLPSLLQDPFSFWTWVFVAAGYQVRCRVGCNKRDLPPSFAIMVTLLQKFFFKEFKKTTSIDLWVLWNHITSFWCLSNLLCRTHTPFMRSSISYFEELLRWWTVIGSWPARLSKTILMWCCFLSPLEKDWKN